MSDEILCAVGASGPRRALGVGVLAVLGLLLIYIAVASPPAGTLWQGMLIGLGAGAVWLADRMRRATMLRLELTPGVLRRSDGEVLARVEHVRGIDRGAFAFKPSHGFTLKLADGTSADWQPGLYWRVGKRLGVGGVTPGAQTKIMADMIAAMIAGRSDPA